MLDIIDSGPSAPICYTRLQSPVGPMVVGSIGGRLCLCDWDIEPLRSSTDRRFMSRLGVEMRRESTPVIEDALAQLGEYFAGERREFDLPLRLVGTSFQVSVWRALAEIPYGALATYKDVAEAVGSPRGVRAVAAAIGANPISIILPCHRVIGSDGSLTGYAGGIAAKAILLELEGCLLIEPRAAEI